MTNRSRLMMLTLLTLPLMFAGIWQVAVHGDVPNTTQPFVSTAVFTTTGTSVPLGGGVLALTSVFDTAKENGVVDGFTPHGSVTYTFFTNNACSGSGTSETARPLLNGLMPNSSPTGQLLAGQYSYQARYSGDGHYPPSTSECEPFVVLPRTFVSTVLFTNAFVSTGFEVPDLGSILSGTSIYDTTNVAALVPGKVPSGTVTYAFFNSIGCSGASSSSETVILTNGVVPNSTGTSPLAVGSYSYQASYSGDANYPPSTSACESFTVIPGGGAVGGESVSIDKLGLLAPYVGLASVVAASTYVGALFLRRVRKK